MVRKKNLADALKGEGRKTTKPEAVKIVHKEESEAFKNLIVKISEDYHYNLKALALQKKTTVRELCSEAISDLFVKYS